MVQLLQRKPANRLGLRGACEVKEHAWFKNYPWKDLYEKKLPAPYIPKIGDNFDAKYCNQVEKLGESTKEKFENYLKDEKYKIIFKDFFYRYDKPDPTHKKFQNPHLSLITGVEDKVLIEKDVSKNIEKEFNCLQKKPTSMSTSALLRQYKVNMNQSGFGLNLNYINKKPKESITMNKSLIV